MNLDKIFVKINQNIINRFRELEDDIELSSYNIKEDRFFPFLTIFDNNGDKKFNPDEVNTVFDMVLNGSDKVGDDFILTEENADKIVENTPMFKNSKITGREFVFFIQNLFVKMGMDIYSNGNIRIKETEQSRITYYEDGTLEEVYDKETNKLTSYYPNGKIKSIEEHDELRGNSSTFYYLSGNVYKEHNVDDSIITYYENGQIKEENNNNGSYTKYYENGQIKTQHNSEAETTEDYYLNGQLKSRSSKMGYEEFYESGQLKYIVFFVESGWKAIKYDEQGGIILDGETNPFANFESTIESLNSDKDRIKLIKELNRNNIIEFLDCTKINLNKFIDTNIKDENMKKEIFSYIENTLKERFKIGLKNIKSATQIKNKYHEGDEFEVKWKGNKIYITNINTKEKATIDTKKLVQSFPKAMQYLFLIRLQNLPGEVLMDMANEASYTDVKVQTGIDGLYIDSLDMMAILGGTFSQETIVHELAHAIDNIFQNNKFSTQTAKILSSFEEEKMKNEVYSDGSYRYCAKNVREFFAESYTLMMLGENYRAAKAIENNFPRTFALIKDLLAEIRQLPKEYRHRQDIG